MLRTIFYSDEFMSPDTVGQKTKSAFEYVASSLRAVTETPMVGRGMRSFSPKWDSRSISMSPRRDSRIAADYWMSDGSVIERINFAVNLTSNKLPDARVQLRNFPMRNQLHFIWAHPSSKKGRYPCRYLAAYF
jgi:hypothetical protein